MQRELALNGLPWENQTRTASLASLRLSLMTIIMSSERQPEANRIRKIARSFKGKLSSLLHSSRAPTSSIGMDSSSEHPTG